MLTDPEPSMRLVLALFLASPALASTPEPAPADAAQAVWQPSDDEIAVHRALSGRHFDGDCARVEALSDTPVDALKAIVRHAQAPPWAPMRAAACLTKGHAEASREELEQWVSDPALAGLGIQTLSLIDTLPEPIALSVAAKALADGPERLDARTRLADSERPAVRALVAPAEVGP